MREDRTTRPPAIARRSLAVIIPTLNEEARIARRLRELAAIPDVSEILVVDGGSDDRTVAISRSFAGVRTLESARGRASQMNAGAAQAFAEVLLFLHADVGLPVDTARWVERALEDPTVVAGAFRTRTVADGGRSWARVFLPLADLRSRLGRLPYGDQAVFVRREAFERVGGFPEQPLMEDLELARRLRRHGRIVTVPAVVRVSGRRFLAQPVRAAVLMRLLPLLYRLGVPPRVLARLYGDPR